GASSRSGGHDPAGMGQAAAAFAGFFGITTADPVDVDPAEAAPQVAAAGGGRSAGPDSQGGEGESARPPHAPAAARAVQLVRPHPLAGGPLRWDERAETEAGLRALGLSAT